MFKAIDEEFKNIIYKRKIHDCLVRFLMMWEVGELLMSSVKIVTWKKTWKKASKNKKNTLLYKDQKIFKPSL